KNLADTDRSVYLEYVKGIDEDVEGFLQAVDRHLEPYLRRAINRVPDVQCLKDGVAYQIRSGGKQIRAALCTTVCELFGGSYLRALNFAVAIEHLQNFTLIHDDIADGDSQRRGQESVWRKFGIPHAINIGDVFVSLSALAILESTYSQDVKLKLIRAVSEFGLEIAEGQNLDIDLRQNDSPTMEEYMKCTRKKTGAFLAMATVGGAIIGGASDNDLMALRKFAMLAGTAFQVKDDVLALTGAKGRNVGSDLLEGKRTLLVIYASQHASAAERKRLFHILNKPRAVNTSGEIQWSFDLYQKTGAIKQAEQFAEQLTERAIKHIMMFPETEAKYRLIRLSKYLSRRAH
ncbi:MAG: polyprenyl synthetase family protein, partial [bacterium]